jgi:hypothetical protein
MSSDPNANAISRSERIPRAVLLAGLTVLWGGIAWLIFDLIHDHIGAR